MPLRIPATVRLRRYRLLLWCLVLSLAVHFLIVPLIMGLFGFRRTAVEPKEQIYQATSSSLELARVARPRPARPLQRPQPQVRPQPQQQPVQRTPVQPRPQLQRPQQRQVARIEPHGRIAVPHVSRQQLNFAAQQAQFEKTIAQLRRESNPVVSAARPVETPGAPKRYTFDFHGSVGTAQQAEGILTPVKHWQREGYNYYYVQYWVQYADGTTETGYVPWPLRYVPQNDPFVLHWEHFPLPVPLPDYVLPPGTNLHPLVAFCYEHRGEFSDCPIAHD